MAPRALARMLLEKLRAAHGDGRRSGGRDSLGWPARVHSGHVRGWAGNSSVYTPANSIEPDRTRDRRNIRIGSAKQPTLLNRCARILSFGLERFQGARSVTRTDSRLPLRAPLDAHRSEGQEPCTKAAPPPTRWSTWAARAPPSRLESSGPGTRSTSARSHLPGRETVVGVEGRLAGGGPHGPSFSAVRFALKNNSELRSRDALDDVCVSSSDPSSTTRISKSGTDVQTCARSSSSVWRILPASLKAGMTTERRTGRSITLIPCAAT